MKPQLVEYLRSQLALGFRLEQIIPLVRRAGYHEQDINEAVAIVEGKTPPPQQVQASQVPHHTNRKIPLAVIVIVLILLLSGVGAGFWFVAQPRCGDGTVDESEDMWNCCEDAGCLGDQTCGKQGCEDPVCGACEYLEDHTCKKHECCADSECDDGVEATTDTCVENACSNSVIDGCVNDDGYCHSSCVAANDTDCTNTGKKFENGQIEFFYPPTWNLFEDRVSGRIALTSPDKAATIILDKWMLEKETTVEEYSNIREVERIRKYEDLKASAGEDHEAKITVIETKQEGLAGRVGQREVLAIRRESKSVGVVFEREESIYFVEGKEAYYIEFHSPLGSFDNYKEGFSMVVLDYRVK